LEKEYSGKGYGDFKSDLGDVLAEWMAPIQQKRDELLTDVAQLYSILDRGREKAEVIAQNTLTEVYNTVGLGR